MDDNDDDAERAAGIEATVGDRDMPKVSGTDPALAGKDPSEVTMDDLAGLDSDEIEEVMQVLNADTDDLPDELPGGTDQKQPSQSEPSGSEQSDHEPVPEEQGEPDHRDLEETTSETDDGLAEPDPATLDETGLLDENGEFPWEGESLGETSVGEGGVIERFRYKKTNFEVREPEDRQRFERHFDSLAEAQEIDDRGKRRATADRYSKKVAQQCLTVDGHPIDAVYRVEHNGTAHAVPDENGTKGLASHSAAEPLWDAMTWFDRFKLGMRLGEDVLGERQFRQRVS